MDFIEKELEKTLKNLGCNEITSKTQIKNGTTCWELPVYIRWAPNARVKIAEYSSGYCRNLNEGYCCFQINPRVIIKRYLDKNGDRYYNGADIIMLMSRAERLAKLVSYVVMRIKKVKLC